MRGIKGGGERLFSSFGLYGAFMGHSKQTKGEESPPCPALTLTIYQKWAGLCTLLGYSVKTGLCCGSFAAILAISDRTSSIHKVREHRSRKARPASPSKAELDSSELGYFL